MVTFNPIQHHITRNSGSKRLCDGQPAGEADISVTDLDALRESRGQATLCPVRVPWGWLGIGVFPLIHLPIFGIVLYQLPVHKPAAVKHQHSSLLDTVVNLISRVLDNLVSQDLLDDRRGAYSVQHQIAVVNDHADAGLDQVTVDNQELFKRQT